VLLPVPRLTVLYVYSPTRHYNCALVRCNHFLTQSQAAEADRTAGVIKSNVESVAKDAKAEAMRVVDKFDHRVEAEAAKAKGGISSWFGGSK
jgi:hypothetical protein